MIQVERKRRDGCQEQYKETASRDFRLLGFFINYSSFPQAPGRFEFFRQFVEIFAAQGAPPVSLTPAENLPPVSLTPVANLPPVSTTLAKLLAKFAAGAVDAGGAP